MLELVNSLYTQYIEEARMELFGELEGTWIFVPTCQQFHQCDVRITCCIFYINIDTYVF